MKPTLYLLAALLSLSQCKKQDPDPLSLLPPATQTGAGIFGCLVNGKVWLPKGSDGASNYTVSYDAHYNDGTLSVAAYQFGPKSTDTQLVGIASDSLKAVGTYRIKTKGRHGAGYVNNGTGCKYYTLDATTYSRGQLTITRFDLKAGIISGTFEFTLYTPGCDSIRVTNGRFDRQL